ncbi:PLP-dependent aminotransferase family protein [Microbacterium sulfonylureivorans]|uniref:MocR-like pyridoxine biosynthesis transcription factor PdxR n=1 Tax=Microbacterium sulfonylureivorans TaxID=2486854 RepID=UPI000FDA7686|nr:PLP-dependent aminotransferase family protein [Microbacterium sulfonylureivorans]
MAETWTTFDLSLALELPPGGRPAARLQGALRDAVRTGVLPPGDALPSTRALAAQLGLARGTVVAVYEQLTAEGYLITQPGGRTRVSMTAGGTEARSDQHRPEPRPRYDLRPGIPDLRRFPAADWAWAHAEAARRVGRPDLDYGDGRGHPLVREVLAGHLRRVRAAATSADRIVMGNGFAQCVALTIGVLAARGVRRIAVEDPGDRSVDGPARNADVELVPVPVDESGMRTDLLAVSGAHAAIVTPAHQSPSGVVLSATRRRELVEWAARTGGWIVEDDYDSEFRYDRQPIGAVQGLAPDCVILIGSASKTHAPAVRLAWMAAPANLVEELAAARRATDRGGAVLDELALAALVQSGRHDRHVRTMRAVYSARRGTAVAALARAGGPLTLTGLSAGFHGVLALPPGSDEAAVVAAAADRSLLVEGMGSTVRRRDDLPPALVLGFGNIDDDSLVEAIDLLSQIIAEHAGEAVTAP